MDNINNRASLKVSNSHFLSPQVSTSVCILYGIFITLSWPLI